MTKFYFAPGSSGESPDEDKMLKAHDAEAAKYGAEFFNYGKYTDRNLILSKTSRGILESRIDPATTKVSHYWHPL
jgi:hypothetical protein